MLAQELVNGAGGAGELGVVVIMADDNSLRDEAGRGEGEGGALGFVKITVEESEGDFCWQILLGEVREPSFFDNGVIYTILLEFVNEGAA